MVVHWVALVPFTQPVQGRNVEPLFHFSILYKAYKQEMEGHCCSASEPASEVVTELNRYLCKRENRHGGTRVGRF